jgi:two-component system, cell cycle response regulator
MAENKNGKSGDVTKFTRILAELKQVRGMTKNGFVGNQDVLAKVRAYETADAAADVQAHSAAVRDGLDRLAILDPLTELYNHRAFAKELQAELKRAARYHHTVILCMFNIDGFDNVVRTYGQLTGEAMQKVMGSIIKAGIRDGDVAAKYGGPLFAVSFPRTSISDAAILADNIRQKIGNQVISHNWQSFSATASVGLAEFPDHANEYDELIARATEMMEHAIERGGDRVVAV